MKSRHSSPLKQTLSKAKLSLSFFKRDLVNLLSLFWLFSPASLCDSAHDVGITMSTS